MRSSGRHSIEIGYRTIVFTVLLSVLLLVLWQLSGILIGIYVSFLIMAALNPVVTKLERIKIPRGVSSLGLLIVVLVLFLSGLAALIPPVVEQTASLFSQLPRLLKGLGVTEFDPALLSSQLGSVPGNIYKMITGALSNLVGIFMVIVVSYYLLLERGRMAVSLTKLFGDEEKEIEEVIAKVETKLGGWIRGQIILSLVVGLAVYIGLAALKIQYALPLAIVAGILEIIPNVGPTISMIPAAIVGFTMGSYYGLLVILLYFVIQQLENSLLVPQVMKKAVGLNPLVTLISLMVGYRLGGPLAAVLAIPLVLTGGVLYSYYYEKTKK